MIMSPEGRCHCGRQSWEYRNCLRLECENNGSVKMVKGDDPGDSQPMQVGRIEQLTETDPKRMVPRSIPESERIIAHPYTGQGDSRILTPRPTDPPPGYGNGAYDVMAEMTEEAGDKPTPAMEEAAVMHEKLGNDPSAGGGLRLNAGKLRMDLLPPEWIWALSDVLTKGLAKGYEERNWEKGMEWSTMVGCVLRHFNKFLAGKRYDGVFDLEKGTTGCHELAMAAWNILGLMSYDIREIGRDDLPRDVTLRLLDRVNAETSDLKETRDDS